MEFHLDIADDVSLYAEPAALQQLVTELLCNARTFSNAPCQIHLEIRQDGASGCCIRVRDTGPGFPASLSEAELTTAFVSTGKAGKGIGLAAVQGLVQAHGGELRLFNDGGAVAECHFPAAPGVGVSVEKDPLSVWVVEDEPALLDFIVDTLENKGFAVSPFIGAEALLSAYTLEGRDPDVLLLDVVLPEVSGPELLQVLNQRGFRSAVLWSSGFTADAAKLAVEGRTGFLQKPYTSADLCQAIEGLVRI
jgi:CheY-like chemotaxis protein